jgi:DNA repair exonuclease SbcCD ATPase subunit
MSTGESVSETVRVEVENLGGIDSATVELPPGVTVLTGRNATNRTSLLRAIMAALGSDEATLKGDADQGSVTLSLGDETHTRQFERSGGPGSGGGVSTAGDPYVDDPTAADLFAFLLGPNEARQAVRTGADLRDLVMRPVDTSAINAEIERLEAEKRRLEAEIEEREDLEEQKERLLAERSEVTTELESVESDLETAREDLAAVDASLDEVQDHQEAVEETLSQLEETRTARSKTANRLESERESIEALREERSELTDELDELPAASDERLSQVETELDRLREHRRSLESTINQLGQVVQFNESVLDGETEGVVRALSTDGEAANEETTVTDQLLPEDDDLVCWTCGSSVATDAIDETLETLRSLRSERVTERQEVSEEIDELQAEKRDIESTREERRQVERRLEEIEAEIERRESTIEDLESEIETVEAEIETLEETLEQRQERDYSTVLDHQRRINELEFEHERLVDRREELDDEIERVETRLDERERLHRQLETVTSDLQAERSRIDRLEADLVETFNEHMDAVRSLLEYENVERIWLERKRTGSNRGGGGTFDLHVVRDTESGTAYEDTIRTLSESEREVAGLVFALAGYLAYEVYEEVPFVLLDSLEAIDSNRIAALVEYFAEHAPYLVVALLEEDAAAIEGAAERVEMG